ncbi:MAG TPA: SIS domain-containing protein [Solirubrobacteraceae bacterium]|nr:SIS domain-containing protein [Solirubrobacteraceae bacterium]HUA72247.1 SIS domain-containing protein [Solirubrobacteraceae bacterium]
MTVAALLSERTESSARFFETSADGLARVCHRMAERFARGGRLIAFGRTPAARSDARHVAVEFVHPVIVGKRALPAIALVDQIGLLAAPDDIAMGFGADCDDAIAMAHERGCLTIAFAPVGAEWEFEPPTSDPYVRQELVETLYHVLWELVHVFFEHRGLLEGRTERRVHDAGASSFLYPFLDEREDDLEAVLQDVRRSILMKAAEVAALREQTLTDNADVLVGAADALRRSFAEGGKLLALGNGGSATDAMDVVADFHAAGRPAIDLTEDPGILTAIANDIGVEAIFSRQVIAYGAAGDVVLALSTSGNSGNVIHALAEARRRGLESIAMVGYDGGRVAGEALADHVVITRSEHIPRIQEAQASAYHALVELVG